MTVEHLRRPVENLAVGKVVEVDGTRIIADVDPNLGELSRVYAGEVYPVGQFGSTVRLHFGRKIIYALVARLRMKSEYQAEKGINPVAGSDERILEADLVGEGEWLQGGAGEPFLQFERGVSSYPMPQQTLYLTPKAELAAIYGRGTDSSIVLGEHVGSGGAECYADLNELLGKHAAIVGSTGSGKSGAVAALVHAILEHGEKQEYGTWSPQIVIFDPHNEYESAFPGCQRLSTDEGTLCLPYWLLDLDETVNLLIGKTEYAATAQANIVKNALLAARMTAAEVLDSVDSSRITVDSPVPYLLGDPAASNQYGRSGPDKEGALYTEGLVGAINEQRPVGSFSQANHEGFNKVTNKIDALLRDERLSFMMRPWLPEYGDPMPTVLGQFLGAGDCPVRIIDLSGVPNEVAGIASAAVARALFSLKVWQSEQERAMSPLVLVCEEAHRYVPDSGEAQYSGAQNAIRRIAKEGRKYGLSLVLVSQRPSEVEATVLSQCSSWLVLRITNEKDRTFVKNMLPDSMVGLTKMVSGLRRREAIFTGQGATLPSRILIRELSDHQLPRSQDIDFEQGWRHAGLSSADIAQVLARWRYQQREGGEE